MGPYQITWFQTANKTFNSMERQPSEWEKNIGFCKYWYNKKFIYRIYKVLKIQWFVFKWMNYDRGVAQPIKCLPIKHEDLSLGFQHSHKKPGVPGCTCNFRARKEATGGSLAQLILSIQENWIISSRFSEKHSLQTKWSLTEEDTHHGPPPTICISIYAHTSVHMHKCIHTHIVRGRERGRERRWHI